MEMKLLALLWIEAEADVPQVMFAEIEPGDVLDVAEDSKLVMMGISIAYPDFNSLDLENEGNAQFPTTSSSSSSLSDSETTRSW